MCGETFKRIIGGGAVITATKEVVFDCAHMLSGHEGLCKNLHGHTYKVQVTVGQVTSGGRDRLIPSGPSASMVIDFKHLKEALNEVIVEPFDHAFVFDMDIVVSCPHTTSALDESLESAVNLLRHRMWTGSHDPDI